eukprot:snap_masked-scaffold_14-processed-gene-8.27-mRNA-1 protein AED:1.00 eAED:1.00 QI:0/-1/0/0/-1/1/1/0/61
MSCKRKDLKRVIKAQRVYIVKSQYPIRKKGLKEEVRFHIRNKSVKYIKADFFYNILRILNV